MNADALPDWDEPSPPEATASEQGAGKLGFAGTAPSESVAEAAGLAAVAVRIMVAESVEMSAAAAGDATVNVAPGASPSRLPWTRRSAEE